jgi:hypothetical protein
MRLRNSLLPNADLALNLILRGLEIPIRAGFDEMGHFSELGN